MNKIFFLSVAALYLVSLPVVSYAQTAGATGKPARIYFNPASGNATKDSSGNIKVRVMVNTGGEDSSGADVIVEFDTSELRFVSGTYPASTTFYPNIFQSMPGASSANASGKIQMARAIYAPAAGETPDYTNGTGTFAELTFDPLVDTGDEVTLDFDFTLGDTEDSNVAGTDITTNPDILGDADSATLTIAEGEEEEEGELPEITSISPTSGDADEDVVVTINGNNFGSAEGDVKFGTRLADIVSWTDTRITVVAPQVSITQDSEYQVKVEREDGEIDTYMGYTYLAPASTGGEEEDLDDTGLPLAIWFGLVPLNGALAYVVKRRWF